MPAGGKPFGVPSNRVKCHAWHDQCGGKPALVYTRVRSTECHFHCGKALIRWHLWQPEKWTGDAKSSAARGYAKQKLLGTEDIAHTEQALDRVYKDELY